MHIVLEAVCIDLDPPAAKHPHNIPPESVKVHIHVNFKRLISLGRCPVIGEIPTSHGLHYRLWVIYMLKSLKSVPVIPAACHLKIHVIPLAKLFYLIFGKTCVLLKNILVRHRIFSKHIKGRMGAVLFHRENPRHIGECNIGLVL